MNRKNPAISAMIGNALEYYDVSLYGFFALMIAPLYFPSSNPLASHIAALGAFAVGFLVRPLGGLIFGHIGDTYGRKRALVLSILLATIPTFTIGILPTYEAIGVWSPVILVCCRLAQGLCTAGEYSGASILIAEYSKQNKVGFACSLLPASSLIGACLGSALGAIVTLSSMPTWAWRIPFLLSIMVGIFGFYLRRQLPESLVFKKASSDQKLEKYPVVGVLKHHKRNFFCAMGIGTASLSFFYVLMMYVIGLSSTAQQPLSSHQSMLLNTGMMMLWMVSLPLMGYFADRVGIKRLMQSGSAAIILAALPLFWFLHQDISIVKIIIVMFTLTILGASFVGPMGAFVAVYFFPPQERYTGVSFGMGLGEAIFGASTPLLIVFLMNLTDNGTAPALYLMFCAFIGLLSVSKARLAVEPTQRHERVSDNSVTKLIA
jgi:MHS family proline/betaine transporter-like MFS transporter